MMAETCVRDCVPLRIAAPWDIPPRCTVQKQRAYAAPWRSGSRRDRSRGACGEYYTYTTRIFSASLQVKISW